MPEDPRLFLSSFGRVCDVQTVTTNASSVGQQRATVGTVIVSFGASPSVAETVSSLIATAQPAVVVENADEVDGSLIAALRRHKNLSLLHGHGNIGYAAAANLGAAALFHTAQPDWILVTNSDVEMSASSLLALENYLSCVSPDVACVALPSTCADDPLALHDDAPMPAAFSELERLVRRRMKNRFPRGAALALRSSTLIQLGGFNPLFFLYFEETDLIERLHLAGKSWEWAPDGCACYHEGAGTTSRHHRACGFELGRSAVIYSRRLPRTRRAVWLISRFLIVGCTGSARYVVGRKFQAEIAFWHNRGMLFGWFHGECEADWVVKELNVVPWSRRRCLTLAGLRGGSHSRA